MSIKLTPDDVKLMSVLYNNRQLDRVQEFLEKQRKDTVERLIAANPDTVQRIQGRAQLLDDLIEAFTYKRSDT